MSLLAFALRRLLWSVPLLLLVMLATYALRGMGGDPFILPEGSAGLPLPPSAAIAVFAILANLVADSLQEALDPRRAGARPES